MRKSMLNITNTKRGSGHAFPLHPFAAPEHSSYSSCKTQQAALQLYSYRLAFKHLQLKHSQPGCSEILAHYISGEVRSQPELEALTYVRQVREVKVFVPEEMQPKVLARATHFVVEKFSNPKHDRSASSLQINERFWM
eukprot:scaffold207892_cov19-Tisochrysis_lutea.AAC.1